MDSDAQRHALLFLSPFLLALTSLPLCGADIWPVSHTVASNELLRAPEVLRVLLFERADATEPLLVRRFEPGAWQADVDFSVWPLPAERLVRFQAALSGMEELDTGSPLWAELEVDGVGVGERFELLAVTPSLSVEGLVESRSAGFGFPDGSVQSTAMDASCPAGSSIRTLGPDGTFTCELDDDTDSGGTVTSVSAGAGLSGGTITTTGTIAVATGGITETMVGTDAITADKIATDAVNADEIATDAVGAGELADDAVDTAAIQDAKVTTAKLANAAVTAAIARSECTGS